MPAQNLPAQIGLDLLSCLGLGFFVGLVRLCLPVCWKAGAAGADFLCTGLAMLLVQSYAVGYSQAGVFRWYMLACAGLGAWSVERCLGFWRCQMAHRAARRWQKWREKAHAHPKKTQRHTKRNKKQLQKNGAVLYNSRV